MEKVTLHIDAPDGVQTVTLDEELTIGRTAESQLVLADTGLSRRNTTFFRDGDEILVVDEGSTNGTFLNDEPVTSGPRVVHNGDRIRVGSSTTISIRIDDTASAIPEGKEPTAPQPVAAAPAAPPVSANADADNTAKYLLIAAVGSAVLIVLVAAAALLISSRKQTPIGANSGTIAAVPASAGRIPRRVIDPLGGEDENSLDDLIASWETEEDPLKAEDLREIADRSNTASDLNVSIEFWRKQLDKALNHGATGAEPAGLIPLPVELVGGNVSKQKAKLAELIKQKNYKQPMDFADLAQLRLEGKFLGELPMATESYVLDIGGSATGEEFSSFEFGANGEQIRAPITRDSPKYRYLKELADNFDGQKYDLDKADDRKQMRIRLLRMYNKNARKGFEEFTNAYYQQFKVPLRVTSLTRSMDYQIGLNKTNSNSFKVSGKGSLPPHTSGCAFDISRKNLTRDEQNFLMQKLSELERARKLDSLREGNANACFHSFIYPDGIEPTNLNVTIAANTGTNDLVAEFVSSGFYSSY